MKSEPTVSGGDGVNLLKLISERVMEESSADAAGLLQLHASSRRRRSSASASVAAAAANVHECHQMAAIT